MIVNPSLLLTILSAFLVAWLIGADSVSPSWGPIISTGSVGVLQGALIGGIFAFLGATLQGGKVSETVGSDLLSGASISGFSGAVVLLISGALIALGVFFHIPIPAVFSVVGAVLGAGLRLGATWNISVVQTLATVWICVPFIALFLSHGLAKALRYFSRRRKTERLLGFLLLIMGAFSAFACGANHIGLAIGLLSESVDVPLKILLIIGGIIMLFGAWMGGPRLVSTVSREYSELGTRRAICALGTTAIITQAATFMGIPVSFNETIIASVIGSGLVTGRRRIGWRKIGKTVFSWVLILFASMGLAWAAIVTFVA